MRFVLLVGLPGSGKSTIARTFIDQGFSCHNADSIRAELYGDENIQGDAGEVFGLFYARLEEALLEQKDIVIDNTNIREKDRKKLRDLATYYGYEVELWHIDVPLEVALKQNAGRTRVVPEEVIVKMSQALAENIPLLPQEGTLVTLKYTDIHVGEWKCKS